MKTSLLSITALVLAAAVSCGPAPTAIPGPLPTVPPPPPSTPTPLPPRPPSSVPTPVPTLPGPEQAVQSAVEQALAGGGIPFKNVSAQVITNDGTYSTVRVSAWFRPTAQSDWVQQTCDNIEARNVAGQWKVTSPVINCQAPAAKATVPPTTAPTQDTQQGWYHLINRHSQKCLAAQVGTEWIVQETCRDGAPQQLWEIPKGTSQIQLRSGSNACVAYNGFNNKLVQAGCTPGVTPWRLVPYWGNDPIRLPHAHPTERPIFSGTYIQIVMADGHCVDDDSWSHAEGQNMIHDDCSGANSDNQLWGVY